MAFRDTLPASLRREFVIRLLDVVAGLRDAVRFARGSRTGMVQRPIDMAVGRVVAALLCVQAAGSYSSCSGGTGC